MGSRIISKAGLTPTNETFHLIFVINRVVLELGIGLVLSLMRDFLGSRSCLEGQGYDNVPRACPAELPEHLEVPHSPTIHAGVNGSVHLDEGTLARSSESHDTHQKQWIKHHVVKKFLHSLLGMN